MLRKSYQIKIGTDINKPWPTINIKAWTNDGAIIKANKIASAKHSSFCIVERNCQTLSVKVLDN